MKFELHPQRMIGSLLWTALTILGGFSARECSGAQSVTVRPVADTSLSETAPNNNLGSQTFTTAGVTQNNTKTRALYLFDIAGTVPAGSLVTSVELLLEVTRQPADGYAIGTFALHRVLVPWGEGNKITANPNNPGQGAPATAGEATWLQRQHGIASWSAPGGAPGADFIAMSSSLQIVYNMASSPYSFGFTPALNADVQSWLDTPAQNFGWMLLAGPETDPFTARRFGSREDAINAPLLILHYEPVPEPACLAGLGCLLGLALVRRSRR